jgi:hypothetical protein
VDILGDDEYAGQKENVVIKERSRVAVLLLFDMGARKAKQRCIQESVAVMEFRCRSVRRIRGTGE